MTCTPVLFLCQIQIILSVESGLKKFRDMLKEMKMMKYISSVIHLVDQSFSDFSKKQTIKIFTELFWYHHLLKRIQTGNFILF